VKAWPCVGAKGMPNSRIMVPGCGQENGQGKRISKVYRFRRGSRRLAHSRRSPSSAGAMMRTIKGN